MYVEADYIVMMSPVTPVQLVTYIKSQWNQRQWKVGHKEYPGTDSNHLTQYPISYPVDVERCYLIT